MNAAHPAPPPEDSIVEVVPVVRRVVAARVVDPAVREDVVQETLARLMASRSRVEQDTLVPYAIAIARNLIASLAEREQRSRRSAHLLTDTDQPEPRPDDEVLRQEEAAIVGAATLAASRGSTPGAIAAQLNRTRSRLRVEYLVAQSATDPPTDRCRAILMALSLGDRRRQRELDVHGHLLACDFCAAHSPALTARRARRTEQEDVRVPVRRDSDVVAARQKGREVAAGAGFTGTELTVIATAISEIARNIVKFAKRGEFTYTVLTEGGRTGLQVVARDSGPGIPDVQRALEDGYSTYRGLGLGLPGARRLMDEFDIVSTVGEGTTVTMIKWRA